MGLHYPWKGMAGVPKLLLVSGEKPTRLECCIQIQMCPVVSQLVTDTLYLVLCSLVLFETFWLRKTSCGAFVGEKGPGTQQRNCLETNPK